jgi:hypothetical protein
LGDVLDSLSESGDIERAGEQKADWSWDVRGLGLPKGTAAKILEALREER